MTRSNENNSATWPDPLTNPDGWAQRAKRYLCALMNMQGSLFESVIEERDRIALACIAVLKDEGNFGNKSRLMAIHAREMAARAEVRDGIAAQLAKEKQAVAIKNEKPKPAALDAAARKAQTGAQLEADMQTNNIPEEHQETLRKLHDMADDHFIIDGSDLTPAEGTDARTGEIIPADAPYPNVDILQWKRGLTAAYFASKYNIAPDHEKVPDGLNKAIGAPWGKVIEILDWAEIQGKIDQFHAEHRPGPKDNAPEPTKATETVAETHEKPGNGAQKGNLEIAHNNALAPITTALPEVAKWEIMRQQADILIKSGFISHIRTPEQAIAIIMMGEAIGIAPIVALTNLNVIGGKVTVPPQLMLGLIRRTKQLEDLQVSDDGNTCTVVMKRKGETAHTEKFSQENAVAMQLANKDNWRKQPAVMRKWRAIAAAARIVFPDAVWGMYLAEEMTPDEPFIEAA